MSIQVTLHYYQDVKACSHLVYLTQDAPQVGGAHLTTNGWFVICKNVNV